MIFEVKIQVSDKKPSVQIKQSCSCCTLFVTVQQSHLLTPLKSTVILYIQLPVLSTLILNRFLILEFAFEDLILNLLLKFTDRFYTLFKYV